MYRYRRRKPILVRSRCIVVDDDGMILMQREENGIYSIPGGRLEWNETIPFCAVRELKEEAGIEVNPIRLVYVVEAIYVKRGFSRHELLFYFLCRHEGRPRSTFQGLEFLWVRPEDVRGVFWPSPLLDRIIEDHPTYPRSYFLVYIDDRLTFINRLDGYETAKILMSIGDGNKTGDDDV